MAGYCEMEFDNWDDVERFENALEECARVYSVLITTPDFEKFSDTVNDEKQPVYNFATQALVREFCISALNLMNCYFAR